ncbi:hypothetical protein D3C77_657280 [compost metagenome]
MVLGGARDQPTVPDTDLLVTQFLDAGATAGEPEHLALSSVLHALGSQARRTLVQQAVTSHTTYDSVGTGASTIALEVAVVQHIFNEVVVGVISWSETGVQHEWRHERLP